MRIMAAAVAILGLTLAWGATALPYRQPGAAPPASEIFLTLDPSHSTVHWSVDSTLHTVHGTFTFKSGNVHIDAETGKASGEIVVAASSGESGNSSRDERMQKEILEAPKYPEIIFRPVQIEGKIEPSGPSDVKVQGIFSIRGLEHDLVAPIHAELTGERWRGSGNFEIPYVKWGLKDAGNFFLKVNPVVKVEVEMFGEVKSTK